MKTPSSLNPATLCTRYLALGAICVGLFGCSTTEGYSKGENMLMTDPPEQNWQVRSATMDRTDLTEWKRPETKDLFEVKTLRGIKTVTPERMRSKSDDAAKKQCEMFDSEILDQTPANGYPRLIWLDSCRRTQGNTVVELHQYIAGKDAGYWFLRKWRDRQPDETLVAEWTDYLRSVELCDTRADGQNKCQPE